MHNLKSLTAPRLSLSPMFSRRASGPQSIQVLLDEVKSKLENHSEYKDLSDYELTLKAKQLLSVFEIKQLLQPKSSSTARPSRRKRSSGNGLDHLVLNLRILDSDATLSSNSGTMTLALELGLNAKSSVLLYWNKTSLVIPYQESEEASSSQLDDTYLIVSFSSASASRLRERGVHRSTTHNLSPYIPTVMSAASVIDRVAEVISKYNTRYYYHQVTKNSEMFIKDTLSAIGLSNVDSILDEFLTGTAYEMQSKRHQSAKHFFNHEDLDSYVSSLQECTGQGHTCKYELKTLEFWYLKFHVEEANQSTVASHLWMCPRSSCKEGVVIAMQLAMDIKDKL